MILLPFYVDDIIKTALTEDINYIDSTADLLIPEDSISSAYFMSKADGVLCGLEVALRVFTILDPEMKIECRFKDGDKVKYGDIIAEFTGHTRLMLKAERTSLNLLQHMSGISSYTNKCVELVKGTNASIADTRKTLPGLRPLQKYAVTVGGGRNHRYNLTDAAMLKDNHIDAYGGITAAVNALRQKAGHMLQIEVETRNLEEVQEAVDCGVNVIMLDNMDCPTMAKAVKLVNGRAKLEASGNVTMENIREVAESGVDIISLGALTHSVKAFDISMKWKKEQSDIAARKSPGRVSAPGIFYYIQKGLPLRTAPNCIKRLALALSHSSNFRSEVVLLLLDALAALVAYEGVDLDGSACCLSLRLNILSDGHCIVLEVLLIEEANFLEVLSETTLNDLFKYVLGLGLSGLLVLGSYQAELYFLLVSEYVGRDISLGNVLCVQSGDLESYVLAACENSCVLGLVGVELNQCTQSAAVVHVGNQCAGHLGETADIHVLTDGGDLLGHILGNGLCAACDSAVLESLNVCRVVSEDSVGDGLNQLEELVALCAEVSFAVDLNDNAVCAVNLSLYDTLGSDSACLLGSLCKALLTEDLNSLISVAVSLNESSLAVHHAAAGHFAKFFNVACCNISHFCSPLTVFYVVYIRITQRPQREQPALQQRLRSPA